MSEMDFIRPLAPIGLVFALVCYARRRDEIGGWLMFFYYQTFGTIVLLLLHVIWRFREFLPSWWETEWDHIIYLAAFLPRLFGFLLVGTVAMVLLSHREWFWVRNLKLVLGVAMILVTMSLLLDLVFFPSAVVTNGLRLIMLALWLFYFSVSKRVHHVFRTHDWDKFGGQITTDS
jgi:hypothetical protein